MAAKVRSSCAIILVDLGSKHNFSDTKLVNRLSLPIINQEQLKVLIANGSYLFTRGMCKGVSWEVQNHKFEIDFMVLPLKGCDIVLGIQWLLSLGDIVWKFSSLIMQFIVGGVPCVIQGIVPGSLAARSSELNLKFFVAMR